MIVDASKIKPGSTCKIWGEGPVQRFTIVKVLATGVLIDTGCLEDFSKVHSVESPPVRPEGVKFLEKHPKKR